MRNAQNNFEQKILDPVVDGKMILKRIKEIGVNMYSSYLARDTGRCRALCVRSNKPSKPMQTGYVTS